MVGVLENGNLYCQHLNCDQLEVSRDKIQRVVSVYAVIVKKEQVLLIELMNGKYFYPGGRVYDRETLVEALTRLVEKEMVGLTLRSFDQIDFFESIYMDQHGDVFQNIGLYFEVEVNDGELLSRCQSIVWGEKFPVWVDLNRIRPEHFPDKRFSIFLRQVLNRRQKNQQIR